MPLPPPLNERIINEIIEKLSGDELALIERREYFMVSHAIRRASPGMSLAQAHRVIHQIKEKFGIKD